MKKKIIGSNYGINYAQKRFVIQGIDLNKFIFKKYYDSQYLITKIENQIFKLKGELNTNNRVFSTKFHRDNSFSRQVSMFHFFDSVSNTNKPWVTQLEHNFNIHKKKSFNPFDYLIKNECKKIIAISNWAKRNQLFQLEDSKIRDEIEKKIIVLHPPQKLFVNSPNELKTNKVTFVMVGNTFFNKGGIETLKIFNKLDKEGYSFHLNIISNLSPLRWPIGKIDDKTYKKVTNEIKSKNYITHYSNLTQDKVFNVIKSSDVGILMSSLENYGNSTLEYKAFGLPCILTTQRAFLETNNDKIGWMVKVDTNELDIIDLSSEEKRTNASNQIFQNGLDIIRRILENPTEIYQKSKMSIEYLKKYHDPGNYINKMTKLYETYI